LLRCICVWRCVCGLVSRLTACSRIAEPDTQDGLLAAYCAACDYYEIPQKLPVLDYFMTAFEQQNRVL